MKRTLILLGFLCSLPLVSCRSVWVHPEYTPSKGVEDDYLCRYGEARPSEEEVRRRALARSQSIPPTVIEPKVPETVNTGSGTNVNVNVGTAATPTVIPGHAPKRPPYRECMAILGWSLEKRFAPRSRFGEEKPSSRRRTR